MLNTIIDMGVSDLSSPGYTMHAVGACLDSRLCMYQSVIILSIFGKKLGFLV